MNIGGYDGDNMRIGRLSRVHARTRARARAARARFSCSVHPVDNASINLPSRGVNFRRGLGVKIRRRLTPVPAENIRDVVVTPSGPVSIKIDLKGRPLETTDQLGRTTKYERDDEGRIIKLVEPEGRENFYEYDENGNVIRNVISVDGKDFTTLYERDNPFGRITKITDPMGYTTSYEYSPDGKALTAVVNKAETGVRPGISSKNEPSFAPVHDLFLSRSCIARPFY